MRSGDHDDPVGSLEVFADQIQPNGDVLNFPSSQGDCDGQLPHWSSLFQAR